MGEAKFVLPTTHDCVGGARDLHTPCNLPWPLPCSANGLPGTAAGNNCNLPPLGRIIDKESLPLY